MASPAWRSARTAISGTPTASRSSDASAGSTRWPAGSTTSTARRTRPTSSPPRYGEPPEWTHVTTNRHPTFDGVARPGAEVTVYVQKQGQAQPEEIGHVRARRGDGAWTLTSRLRLGDGDYAVTASQSGDTSPPAVIYSLQPDSYGNLSHALVIVSAPRSKKEEGGRP